MTPRQITKRLGELKDALKLGGWDIVYHTYPECDRVPHTDRFAEVHYYDHIPQAYIDLPTGRPDDELDFSLRHEMAHVRLRELQALVTQLFDALGEGPATTTLKTAWEDALERACNGIANALTKTGAA